MKSFISWGFWKFWWEDTSPMSLATSWGRGGRWADLRQEVRCGGGVLGALLWDAPPPHRGPRGRGVVETTRSRTRALLIPRSEKEERSGRRPGGESREHNSELQSSESILGVRRTLKEEYRTLGEKKGKQYPPEGRLPLQQRQGCSWARRTICSITQSPEAI